MQFYTKIVSLLVRISLLISVILLPFPKTSAQDLDFAGHGYHNKGEFWPSVKIEKSFAHGVDLNAQYVLRLDGDFRGYQGHYFYLQAKYRIHKYVQSDFQFRYVTNPQQDLFRFEFGLKARYKYKQFTFAYRVAYFREYEYFASKYQPGHFPTNFMRNRIEVKWDFKKKWDAGLSFETWNLFNYKNDFTLKRIAVTASISYQVKKNHGLSLSYLNQPDFSKKSLTDLHGVLLVYTYTIPSLKEIKKAHKKQVKKRKKGAKKKAKEKALKAAKG